MRAKRHLGQHFLSDPRILGRIADALEAAPGDRVLEIGPGRGALTRVLLDRGVSLVAIERDRALLPGLAERCPDATIIAGDALDLDWHRLAAPAPGEPWLVIGNIPYNITSPLLDKALEPPRPARIVFLLQREVADRLLATPATPDYGALTVGVRTVARVERALNVPAGAFSPRPRVDSSLVRLTPLAEPLLADADLPAFRRLVTGLFGARRKQLARALRTVLGLAPARAAGLALEIAGDPERRPETLSPAELVALYRAVVDGGDAGV